MADKKKPYPDTAHIPFGLSRSIASRPLSNALAIAFKRPAKCNDDANDVVVPDEPPPYVPPAGYAAVAGSWGFSSAPILNQAVCATGVHNSVPIAAGRYVAQAEMELLTHCFQTASNKMEPLKNAVQPVFTPSEFLSGCGAVAVGTMFDLRRCEHPTTSISEALQVCGGDAAAGVFGKAVGRCDTSLFSASAFFANKNNAFSGASALFGRCLSPAVIHGLPVPCEYYEIPIPPPDPPPDSYVCGLRPPSNRMALRFRRRKIIHAANSIPLPFACFDTSKTPILQTYIMKNTITASFDNGQPLELLAASFNADTSGYCWQGSLTVPPADFIKLGMDGRARGSEAVITVNVNADTFVILAEEYSDNRQFGQRSYTVTGRSLTARLGQDYAETGTGTYRNPIYARQIADEQLKSKGFSIDDWTAADWLIPANIYSITEKTPITVIQELAAACGAFVESDTKLPVLRVKPKWPKAAWQINDAEANVSVPSSVVFKISGQKTMAEKANGVFVSSDNGQGKAADVYREGTDREPRASAVTGALYTDQAVLMAAGVAALSATGIHKRETVSLPVSNKYAIPLAKLAEIWQIQEPAGSWQGVVTGVSLEISITDEAPTVTQSVVIDRYLDS